MDPVARLSASMLVGVTLCATAQAGDPSAPGETPGSIQNVLTPAEKARGFRSLFDGTSTDAWRGYQKDAFPEQGWIIEDGCLKVTAGGGGGDIITVDQFADFELLIEWKVAPNANSGIMFGVTEEHEAPWQTGPEYQILDDQGHGVAPTDPHATGALYALYPPAEGKVSKPAGEFNQTRILLRDGRLRHWLNGAKVVDCDITSADYTERIAKSKFHAFEGFGVQKIGHLALQDHGNDVWFRNIKVREFSTHEETVTLFNGQDLTGWNAFLLENGSIDDVWHVEDGILICKGNPVGYIQTDKTYTSYILTVEWRFNPITKKAGNSGVLLRKIEEDKVWPRSVEAQLHSGNAGDFWNIGEFPMKADPDRTNGRNTRKTHGAENPIGEWNTYEIVVDGDLIQLYVNGEMLNQATDVMEVPGTICLQSEGAEIHFRTISLVPLD